MIIIRSTAGFPDQVVLELFLLLNYNKYIYIYNTRVIINYITRSNNKFTYLAMLAFKNHAENRVYNVLYTRNLRNLVRIPMAINTYVQDSVNLRNRFSTEPVFEV